MRLTRGVYKRVEILEIRTREKSLAIRIGADDPDHLYDTDIMKSIKALARRKGYRTVRGAGKARLFGQNELAQRVFYYTR
jgi:hypothetical protein